MGTHVLASLALDFAIFDQIYTVYSSSQTSAKHSWRCSILRHFKKNASFHQACCWRGFVSIPYLIYLSINYEGHRNFKNCQLNNWESQISTFIEKTFATLAMACNNPTMTSWLVLAPPPPPKTCCMAQKSVFNPQFSTHRNDLAKLAKDFGENGMRYITSVLRAPWSSSTEVIRPFYSTFILKNNSEQIHVVSKNEQTKKGEICSYVVNAMAQQRISNNRKKIGQDGIKRVVEEACTQLGLSTADQSLVCYRSPESIQQNQIK